MIYHGVDTVIERERFELWSPNFNRLPPYPGPRPESISVQTPVATLYDGSLGRHDPTHYPQTFRFENISDSFIPSPAFRSHPPAGVPCPVEWEHLHQHWEPSSTPYHGHPSHDFIARLSARAAFAASESARLLATAPEAFARALPPPPQPLSDQAIDRLSREASWSNHVDLTASVLRTIMISIAWVDMLTRLQSCGWTWHAPYPFTVPPASPQLMGLWLNGSSSDIAHWLLLQGVPAFILYPYDPVQDFYPVDRRQDMAVSGWIPHDLHSFRDQHSVMYDQLAQSHLPALSSLSPEAFPHYVSANHHYPSVVHTDNLSSSWVQGCGRHSATPHLIAPDIPSPSDISLAPASSFAHSRPDPSRDGANQWRDVVSIYSDRFPWVRPPPIAPPMSFPGTHFHLDMAEGFGGFRWRMQEIDVFDVLTLPPPHLTMYDREHNRSLHFSEPLLEVPGLVNRSDSIWGRPVPSYEWVGRGSRSAPPPPSFWMYFQQTPPGLLPASPHPPERHMLPPLLGAFSAGLDISMLAHFGNPVDDSPFPLPGEPTAIYRPPPSFCVSNAPLELSTVSVTNLPPHVDLQSFVRLMRDSGPPGVLPSQVAQTNTFESIAFLVRFPSSAMAAQAMHHWSSPARWPCVPTLTLYPFGLPASCRDFSSFFST
ncbi:hypothetical protein PLICRDRAFT_180815 [Plicaturopsis crispa FD-325 SS-3]|uniref:Uncharacterized protein n=1 Tax=Plicaturopsis crispa FD-325 SS-3 TaxID=944288 RepID=A0A0C9SK28_PLICR|nr:hypothetical protein PLICRDRAFT_180815 [Plicaturopsis crispa FD-325 SS-3]